MYLLVDSNSNLRFNRPRLPCKTANRVTTPFIQLEQVWLIYFNFRKNLFWSKFKLQFWLTIFCGLLWFYHLEKPFKQWKGDAILEKEDFGMQLSLMYPSTTFHFNCLSLSLLPSYCFPFSVSYFSLFWSALYLF